MDKGYCPFVKYKNLFGEPNKGIHAYRILGTPIVDYVLSILLAAAITYKFDIPLTITTIIVFIIAIFLHGLFGVNTPTGIWLGIKC